MKSQSNQKSVQEVTAGASERKPPANNYEELAEEDEIKEAQEDPIDLSDVETPRMPVTNLKLDTAQKEKTSFMQELKKQSFLVSEDSTQKMEEKSMNISAILPKNANNIADSNKKSSGKSSFGLMQQEADKMVKKENYNNLVQPGRFIGDDEDQGLIQEEDQSDEGAQDQDGMQPKDDGESNQAGRTETDPEVQAKQSSEPSKVGVVQSGLTAQSKKGKQAEEDDEEEEEDEENEEFKGGNTEDEEMEEEEAEGDEESEGSYEEDENAPEVEDDVDEVAGTKSGKASVRSGGTRRGID